MSNNPETDETPAGSLLDRVRARRDERLADEHLDLPVPTWDGDLVARYRVVQGEVWERITKRLQSGKSDPNTDADFLVAACSSVLLRDEDGRLQPIEHEGREVGFDKGLASVLGLEVERAREVVAFLVGDNPVALGLLSAKVVGWMQDTSAEVEGQIVGEA